MPQITQIQVRRDTYSNWNTINPTLAQGEIGYITSGTDAGKFKIGDGTTAWNSLTYATDGSKLIGTTAINTTGTASGISGTQTANTVLAAPNGSAGTATFRSLVASDIPTLNQNTTGTASNVTGTVGIGNGGTGAITVSGARSALGIGQQYPPMVSNAYYRSSAGINATAQNIGALNTMYFFPFYVGADTTFKNIGVQTATVTTSSSVQIGIYRDSAGVPATLVYDSGDFTMPTSASITYQAPASFTPLTLTAGWYWMGAAMHGSAASNATFYCYATNVATGVTQRIFGGANIPYSVHACYMTAPASTALPSTPNTLTFFAGFNAPVVSIQVN